MLSLKVRIEYVESLLSYNPQIFNKLQNPGQRSKSMVKFSSPTAADDDEETEGG